VTILLAFPRGSGGEDLVVTDCGSDADLRAKLTSRGITTDPCRPQGWSQGACVAQDLAGFSRATCACQRLPPPACAGLPLPSKLLNATGKACALLDAAATGSRGTRRVRKHLVKTRKKWRMASRLARKRLPPECATALDADYVDAASRVDAALESTARP
jgi:hypothetical protein